LVKEGKKLIPDPLADDLALIIQTDRGLAVILGCAHRGMINTLRQAQKITGEEKIFAVIGGTHLFPASPERVEQTITDLKKMKIAKIGVSHCTGFFASSRLAREFPDAFFLNNAGMQFNLYRFCHSRAGYPPGVESRVIEITFLPG
jgi:7,8-dihydropterin-6-yl-methyl-4-(beta-D-ribofuranosyl)aminobenzene 5'-phosphate synthase